ncbi:hypothetical protein [Maridesulfovibrio sp. FT414]|uniref:hypothetical protein n=1 Tax=Maridesulfovibrio sp. FT414 TaxID=2979469 RepID=UPI003D802697
MKLKLFIFIACYAFFISGCVAERVAKDNVFSSTNSPSLTVTFNNDMQFIGEEQTSQGPTRAQTYFYASKNSDSKLEDAS